MRWSLLILLLCPCVALAQAPPTLPNTQPLELDAPLDVVMVQGINAFAEQEIGLSRDRRARHWNRDYTSPEAYAASIAANRERFRTIIGAVNPRAEAPRVLFDFGPTTTERRQRTPRYSRLRADVLPGVSVEFVDFARDPNAARMILIPDAEWAPEEVAMRLPAEAGRSRTARRIFDHGIGMFVPQLINRSDEHSGHPDIRFTNQPHREFLYRPAFELGRHLIGYEVQKIQTLVDLQISRGQGSGQADAPVVVWGIGEGGLLAMAAAAVDPRIDVCIVSGYFNEREGVWQEPIYRNVWRQLDEFGDADIASLIAPRRLIIEACAAPEVDGPPAPRDGRSGAAPGRIRTPDLAAVEREFDRAKVHFERLGVADRIQLIRAGDGRDPAGSDETIAAVLAAFNIDTPVVPPKEYQPPAVDERIVDLVQARQKRQIDELRDYTQRLLHVSDKARDKVWAKADRSSLEAWQQTQEPYRDFVYDELIGRIPYDLNAPNPRSRKVIDEPTHAGYEVVLDVFASEGGGEPVIAGGILLVPKDLKPGEARPCVVCQHGLEGTPMDTIVTDPNASGFGPYKGFSTQLVQRGFIVYAPQNPYRGQDEFRVIQRKSNPLGRSLFSYIVPQHQQTLNWLSTLPYVDRDRIGFYGLSYGGKTAMRVPPLLPPGAAGPGSPGYCLSICSADFNEWVLKNATTEDRYSYVFTGEYEIFEWNMGHVANYAELASLMTPRPFMVERGHDDGVAPDEWVAWEFAKVQRHYDKLGIGDRAEMEVFNGPHTINGQGTFDFLHRHLKWPATNPLDGI
ncbi:MAG: hypothetical protein KF774_14415 [Planctomyces sp.]|nr:hypothetical protein [Planctomyces sp.]